MASHITASINVSKTTRSTRNRGKTPYFGTLFRKNARKETINHHKKQQKTAKKGRGQRVGRGHNGGRGQRAGETLSRAHHCPHHSTRTTTTGHRTAVERPHSNNRRERGSIGATGCEQAVNTFADNAHQTRATPLRSNTRKEQRKSTLLRSSSQQPTRRGSTLLRAKGYS